MVNGQMHNDEAFQELRAQLGRNEQILYTAKPDKTAYIFSVVGVFFFIGIFMMVGVIISTIYGDPLVGLPCLAALIIAGVVIYVVAYFTWKRTAYAATNKRVIAQVGLLSRTFREAPYERITDTIVFRPVMARIFGAGTIGFNTAGGGTPQGGYEVVWGFVPDPIRVKSHISEIVDRQKMQAKAEEFSMMAAHMKSAGVGIAGPSGGGSPAGGGGGGFCGECGAPLKPGTRFCTQCGAQL